MDKQIVGPVPGNEETAQRLEAYMNDLLHRPEQATLDVAALPQEFRGLGVELVYFAKCLREQRVLAENLSKGRLAVDLPPAENPLAAPLVELHSALKILAKSSQQVAMGDYDQRLGYFGELTDAFDVMTEQLDLRQTALEEAVEKSHRKTLALEQSVSLLEAVMDELAQWIVVMDSAGAGVLFQNQTAKDAFTKQRLMGDTLLTRLDTGGEITDRLEQELEIYFDTEDDLRYYMVISYPIQWHGYRAVAHVISDVTDERRQLRILENFAYQDTLTGISNRHVGMQTLREWLEEARGFAVCFIDLDNLKFVNDNFGHPEGDRYIIAAAELLMRHLPKGGQLCRLGGDEFMVLAPGFGRRELEGLMEDVRLEMIESGRNAERPYLSSMSFGVVEVPKGLPLTSSGVLGLADERMYGYKKAHSKGRGKTYERKAVRD